VEKEEKELEQYQHLADISLRTLATILTIIFAYVFASTGKIEPTGKVFIVTVVFIIILGVIFSCIALYGKLPEVRYVKLFSVVATFLMIVSICVMFVFLTWILFSS
jgi:hypothetical protein